MGNIFSISPKMEFNSVRIIEIPTARDPRGNLSVLENQGAVPFPIARVYWIYDLPSDTERHGHAFYSQNEIIVPLSGSFDIETEDASGIHIYHLDRPNKGLYIPPLTWRSINNFSTLSSALVISSQLFDENDYIRSYSQFHDLISVNRQ